MAYSVAVSAYLERIEGLLADKTEANLLYAAVELRCGVEARMKEYLEPLEHIPKSQKKEWAIAKLGLSIENAFRTGDKIMIFTVRSPRLDAECTLMYIPVSSRLQEIACRLGTTCTSRSGAPSRTQLGGEIFENSLGKATGSFSSRTLGSSSAYPCFTRPPGKRTSVQ